MFRRKSRMQCDDYYQVGGSFHFACFVINSFRRRIQTLPSSLRPSLLGPQPQKSSLGESSTISSSPVSRSLFWTYGCCLSLWRQISSITPALRSSQSVGALSLFACASFIASCAERALNIRSTKSLSVSKNLEA